MSFVLVTQGSDNIYLKVSKILKDSLFVAATVDFMVQSLGPTTFAPFFAN